MGRRGMCDLCFLILRLCKSVCYNESTFGVLPDECLDAEKTPVKPDQGNSCGGNNEGDGRNHLRGNRPEIFQ